MVYGRYKGLQVKIMDKKKLYIIIGTLVALVSLIAIFVFSQKPAETQVENGEASLKFNNDSEAAIEAYPIIAELPIDRTPLFRIDYGVSKKYPKNSKKIALYISSDSPDDQLSAIKYIYEMGYDPSDYEILFKDL
jgi:hypothetical protein